MDLISVNTTEGVILTHLKTVWYQMTIFEVQEGLLVDSESQHCLYYSWDPHLKWRLPACREETPLSLLISDYNDVTGWSQRFPEHMTGFWLPWKKMILMLNDGMKDTRRGVRVIHSNTAASSLYGAQMIIFSSFNLWCKCMRAESEEPPVHWELCSVAHFSPHYPSLMQWFYYCSWPHSDHSRNYMARTSDWDAGETTSLFLSHKELQI